jgi:hypothetical protein
VIDKPAGPACSWCGGPLPAPDEMLLVVRCSDRVTMQTCGVECLAALLQSLTGWARQATAGRRD